MWRERHLSVEHQMNVISVSPALVQLLVSGVISVAVAATASALLMVTRRWHLHLTGDSHLNLPQKIHQQAVPRVGGLAILAGFLAGIVYLVWFSGAPASIVPTPRNTLFLLLGLLPIAWVGFAEDLTKGVSPRVRLVGMVLGSFLLLYSREVFLPRLDIDLIDPLMTYWGVALVFSIFACVGATNAYNIVDGLNGLLAGVALITLVVIAWVCLEVGDLRLFATTALLALAVLGWLPFNWPRARLFAGDGGAYSLGFLTAALIIILLHRNPSVSPWFGLNAAALPIFETLYSIWRRRRTGASTMEPDQSHLHQLVRTRVHGLLADRALRKAADWNPPAQHSAERVVVHAPNGLCSPILWLLHASAAVSGALFYDRPLIGTAIFGGFVLTYIVLHSRLLRSSIKYRLGLQH